MIAHTPGGTESMPTRRATETEMSTAPVASPRQGVVRVLTGHYGSGKSEVSVSLAMALAAQGHKVALGDLDIVNPYFRSREQADVMTEAGIWVISSSLGHESTLDLPAVSAEVHLPLGDPAYDVILDAGGNEVGVKVLAEFAADRAAGTPRSSSSSTPIAPRRSTSRAFCATCTRSRPRRASPSAG